MINTVTPGSIASYPSNDTSACHGAFAGTSAAADNLAAIIKDSTWIINEELGPKLSECRVDYGEPRKSLDV